MHTWRSLLGLSDGCRCLSLYIFGLSKQLVTIDMYVYMVMITFQPTNFNLQTINLESSLLTLQIILKLILSNILLGSPFFKGVLKN